MKHFDLFSGYGGFTLAIERVYVSLQNIPDSKEHEYEATDSAELGQSRMESNSTPRLGNTNTIGFSEIDKYASAVLKYHWPDIKNYGDISKINWSEVPDFDLLTGGSPCQDLSIAGKRAGLEGSRSGLFYEFIRALHEKKPAYFIWENVKGALSSNQGRDFAIVLNEMAEAGYSLWWQILNAKDFGVPQNRERIFVVGFRDGSPREVFFEAGVHREVKNLQSEAGGERQGVQIEAEGEGWDKPSPEDRGGDEGRPCVRQLNNPNHSNNRVYSEEGLSHCLNTMQGGNRQPFVAIPESTKQGYAIAEEGDSINLSVPNSKTRRGRVGKGIAQTLDTGMQQHTITDARIRRLTPIECERLMGLPDGWTAEPNISDSQRYKMCGNGVVVPVVEEIIKQLILCK